MTANLVAPMCSADVQFDKSDNEFKLRCSAVVQINWDCTKELVTPGSISKHHSAFKRQAIYYLEIRAMPLNKTLLNDQDLASHWLTVTFIY